MAKNRQQQLDSLCNVLDTLDILRVKCPWDAKQTNESLRPNTIEEVYELAQALLDNNEKDICKELGDVLLHVFFYSKIGSEKGSFDIGGVADALNNKLISRHPHVFGTVKAEDAETVSRNWEEIKLREKGGNKTVLAGVPATLPALVKAFRVQEKAANVGFDWENASQVWDKVKEEISEVEEALAVNDKDNIEAEFGDLIFSLVNAARLYGVNPENALERTNRKFITRFNYLEAKAKEQGRELKSMSIEEMDALWNLAKKETGV